MRFPFPAALGTLIATHLVGCAPPAASQTAPVAPRATVAPSATASDSLDSLSKDELAMRLLELTGPWAPRTDPRVLHVARLYAAYYDRPTLIATIRFYQSEQGRAFIAALPTVTTQTMAMLRAYAALQAAGRYVPPEAPSVPPEAVPPAAPALSALEAAGGTPTLAVAEPRPGEVERGKQTCKKPALSPLPDITTFEEAKSRLAGRWYACTGKFEPWGQEGPGAAAGIEFTPEGHWFLLDVAPGGMLKRRPVRDMRDQFSGKLVWDDGGHLLVTMDSPTPGLGGYLPNLTFASTAPALDFDQARLVRLE